jgi:hypothetical protein
VPKVPNPFEAASDIVVVLLQSRLKCLSNQRAALPGPFAYPAVSEALEPPYQRRPHGVIEGDAGSGVATQVVHEGPTARTIFFMVSSRFLPTSARNLPEVAVSGSRGTMVGV